MNSDNKSLTYADAGVDIEAGNQLVNRIKPLAQSTRRPEVLGSIGGFGGFFELPAGYKKPVLVSGTDGVGTKLKLAIDLGLHDTIGIDLVAMCVNDLLVTGAEPLFFLDYYATGKLDVDTAAQVIAGIAEGCRQSGCSLIGGETAEMPGMYQAEDYDLAGFCVGIVERDLIIDGSRIKVGDKLIAIASSGVHSNGYSLVRRILKDNSTDLHETLIDGTPLGKLLLEPTRIYASSLKTLAQEVAVKAFAHITGGGITENLPRVFGPDFAARIDRSSWQLPPLFSWLQKSGGIADVEMLRTFNCGVGMIAVIAADEVDVVLANLAKSNETAWVLGEITPRDSGQPAVTYSRNA